VPAQWLPTLKLGGGYLDTAYSNLVDPVAASASVTVPTEVDKMLKKVIDTVAKKKRSAFGNGNAPVWTNNGHTLELAPNHQDEVTVSSVRATTSVVDDSDTESRRLTSDAVDEVAAASAASDQKSLLSGNVNMEEHFQAQQEFVNENVGSIDIGDLSRLLFQGPTLAANNTDEGWDEGETRYDLLQLHLHWGRDSNEGSEHQIGGGSHPLELHLVHTQRGNPYPTRSPGGLLAVSIMFDIDDTKPNPSLARLVTAVQKGHLRTPGSQIASDSDDDEFHVRSLLPEGFETNYLTYRGSLTTPGCFQSVNWVIAGETLTVSSEQLAALRSVDSLTPDVPLTHNFRPVQPRNGRVVWMKGNSAYDKLDIDSSD